MKKQLKPKDCKECGKSFNPFSSLQKVCCVACSIKYVDKLKTAEINKEFNRETRRLKDKVKTRGQWLKEAQSAFNSFIRDRDADLTCISCGRHHSGQYHAGHYKTVGANPELRFNEDNCHKQCAPCNNHLSGNISNYRPALLDRIGLGRLSILEGPHSAKKYTIEEIKEIKATYKRKLKELKEG